MVGTVSSDLDAGSKAVQEYAAGAVATAAEFDPGNPSWRGATAVVLGDPFLRDLLIVQMILQCSWATAAAAMPAAPSDPEGNRDAVIAAALWLAGSAEDAAVVAMLSRNRTAQMIGTMITVGVPAQRWADALVDEVLGPR